MTPDPPLSALAEPTAPEGDRALTLLVVKEGEQFLVADDLGDVEPGPEGFGWYRQDTRHLSELSLRVGGGRPSLLSASDDLVWTSSVDLTNPPLWRGDELVLPSMTVNVRRVRVLAGRLHERIRVRSYAEHAATVEVSLALAADFADVFEVRGLEREHRGEMAEPSYADGRILFGYLGEDGVRRETDVRLDPPPDDAAVDGARVLVTWRVHLAPHGSRDLYVSADAVVGGGRRTPPRTFGEARKALRDSYREWDESCAQITTDNEVFNDLLDRGKRDLRALLTPTPYGPVFAAGIPWYVTLFGRDALLASHQALLLNPEPARAALRVLAAYQGRQVDPWRDEEPGKILHEVRHGELAGAGYVPHTPYYGTVDATPLFCVLFGTYVRWTGDRDFAQQLLPNAEAALRWVEEHGTREDGLVYYDRRSPRGLVNQGWKDSQDSVVHTDGSLAPYPVALAEVQGYVHLARLRMADVYSMLGDQGAAVRQLRLAAELKARFDAAFWMPDEEYYALAVDGEGNQVRSVTTNPAHGLYCRIVPVAKAAAVTRRLLAPDMYSGWGVRTLSRDSAAYNPMSYHDGSVWPHDNAILAAGLKRYGEEGAMHEIVSAVVESASAQSDRRLPELFCGFDRRAATQPVAYPVACRPQAWAAGAPFLMLQAMLGISPRADNGVLTVNKPSLPPWLHRVTLRDIAVGPARLSLEFVRMGERTSFTLLDRQGDVRVVMAD